MGFILRGPIFPVFIFEKIKKKPRVIVFSRASLFSAARHCFQPRVIVFSRASLFSAARHCF
jgi:hypothetical protein